MKSDGYKDAVCITIEKDDRIEELVEDDKKVIIVCRYLDQIEKIKKILLKTDKKIFVISGQVKEPACVIADRAEHTDKAVIIIQAGCSDGYSLKSFNHMIFASMSYSFVDYDQMTQRMKAADKKTPCQYTFLITRGKTVDKGVYDSVMKGEDFNEQLYDRSTIPNNV